MPQPDPKKSIKIHFFCLLVLIVFNTSCSFNDNAQPLEPIILGEFSPLTGSLSHFGSDNHKGIMFAIEQQNKKGGIRGRKVKILTRDTKSLLSETKKVVTELISYPEVVGLLGEVSSSLSLAAAPIAQKNKIAMITPSSTNPKVTEVGPYIFRICFIDPFQGYAMAQFAHNQLKIKKVAILRDRHSDYSMGLAEDFKKTFQKLGGQIIDDLDYSSGDIDFKSQLSRIRSQKPDALFIPGYYREVAFLTRQARSMGIKAKFLGGDGWDSSELFNIARDAIKGSFFTNHFSSQIRDKRVQKFVTKFSKRFGHPPNSISALAYDATQVFILALQKTKKVSRKNIFQQLSKLGEFQGMTGSIRFNKKRNARKPAHILKIDGPIHRFITSIEP